MPSITFISAQGYIGRDSLPNTFLADPTIIETQEPDRTFIRMLHAMGFKTDILQVYRSASMKHNTHLVAKYPRNKHLWVFRDSIHAHFCHQEHGQEIRARLTAHYPRLGLDSNYEHQRG